MAEVLIALEGCLTGKVLEDTPAQPQEPLAAFLTYLAAGEDAASAGRCHRENRRPPRVRFVPAARQLRRVHVVITGGPPNGCLAAGAETISAKHLVLRRAGCGRTRAWLWQLCHRDHLESRRVRCRTSANPANATPAAPQSESNSEPLDALEEAWSWKTPDTLPASGSTPDRSYQLAFDGASSYAVVPSLKYDPNQEYTIEGWFTLLGERQSTTDPVIWTGPRWIAIWEQYQRFGLGTTGTGPTEIISSHFSAPPMVPVHVAGIWNKSGQSCMSAAEWS